MELFKLFGTIAIDNSEANDGIDETTEKAEKSHPKITAAFGKIGTAAVKMGKVVATGLAAGSAAIGAIVKQSVDSYAEYEQLVGGVETLFKDSADKVMEYAANAYQTAGMSANEYMETVTSFSASLLQGLASHTSETYEESLAALEDYYDTVEESADEALDLLKDNQDAEVEAFEAATDAKIALIDKQYRENLKLIDEEKYNRLKAIDEQIEMLNGQTEAEKAAIEKRKQQQRIADLEEKVRTAKDVESRKEAQQDLSDYLEELAQKEREAARKEQIEALKDQKEVIREEASVKKEAAKEQYNAEVAAIQESSKAQLKALKKAHEDELEALKESNKAKLEEAKRYVEEQKVILEANKTVTEYTAETYALAAEYANRAITDMSDNANKMGTDISLIQNAYNGFAKQNYTMLDNLKLGYGGTASEMERLLKDAQKLTGVEYDLSSFADIVEAIHAVQVNMGISGLTAEEAAEMVAQGLMTEEEAFEAMGTTAKEASSTIQGSMAAAKAAWSNLLTGIADDNADFDKQIDSFVVSAGNVVKNILPRVEIALRGMGKLVDKLFPIIMDRIPAIITEFLPQILQSGANLLETLIEGISENQDSLAETAFDAIMLIAKTIMDLMPKILDIGVELLLTVISGIADNLDKLGTAAKEMVRKIIDVINSPGALETLIDSAVEIIIAIATGIVEFLPELADAAVEIIVKLATLLTDKDTLGKLLDAALEVILKLAEGLIASTSELVDAAVEIIGKLFEFLLDDENLATITQGAIDLIVALSGALIDNVGNIAEGVTKLADKIVDVIFETDWVQVGKDIIHAIGEGFSSMFGWNTEVQRGGGFDQRTGTGSDWGSNKSNRVLSGLSAATDALGMLNGTAIGNKLGSALVQKILDGSHADGLNYVPYDGYVAELHEGEMVVPADESRALRSGFFGTNDGVVAHYLQQLIDMLADYLPQVIAASGHDIVTNDGTVLAHYGPLMNAELGRISNRKDRGR